MPNSPQQLRALVARIDSVLDGLDGYLAIEWALRKRGYSISPSYRRNADEWMQFLRQVFLGGRVTVMYKVKPLMPFDFTISGTSRQDDRVIAHLRPPHGGTSWDFDVTDAEYVDGELRGAAPANHPVEEVTIRQGPPVM
jgi:hypothetical protein